jgi:predicted nucleotidyltransferase component of viral defense system
MGYRGVIMNNSALNSMLGRYDLKNAAIRKHAMKEIIQEISLLGLFRSGFFSKAAFYGGSALRIFYGLDRFSEDLDFSLLQPDADFNIDGYLGYVKAELGAFGFEVTVERKVKAIDSQIKSAFIKGGTLINICKIQALSPPISGVQSNETLKVKLEIDTDPPAAAGFEVKYLLQPIPFSVRNYDLPSLFAGKLHALLCRKWKNRVKGRDFYDYLWFLSHDTKVNLEHLANRLQQTGFLEKEEILTMDKLQHLLKERFHEIDFQQAKQDVKPFITNPEVLNLWSEDFFCRISEDKLR